MKNELINLQTFDETDFNQLIAAIPDARFLLQWTGQKYIYPLNVSQLRNTLKKTTGEQPTYKVFKAIRSNTSEPVGHIQLMDIDYSGASCVLGRVLIFPDHRGKGFGKAMVGLAVKDAFESLGLNEITLNVFDFNESAIATYKSIGFIDYQLKKGALMFQNETWNIIKMKLSRHHWLNKEIRKNADMLLQKTAR
jgi:RimJ/RimL family protein N-acetyltransferase